MTLYHQLLQARLVLESQLIKHIKNNKQSILFKITNIKVVIISPFTKFFLYNFNFYIYKNISNDRRNPFHFACRQWYSYNNSTMML